MPRDERHDLYVKYYDRVVRYLVGKHRFTVEEARDLAQDVFLRVFRHMEREPLDSPWFFLRTTAHNTAVNEIRKRVTRRQSESGSADALPQLEETALRDFWNDGKPLSPEDLASGNEESALLRTAIETLSPPLRQCLLLRLDGLSYEEIATALRVSEDVVRTRLRDAKRLLIDRLRPGGG